MLATGGERSHDLLRELGAEPVVYGDGLLERVQALAPDGVDVALDLVGSDEAMDVSLALVADRDRIASIANFARAPREGIKLLGGGPGADAGDEIRAAARPELARLAGQGTSAWSSPRRTPSTTRRTPTVRSAPATPPARSSWSRDSWYG